MPGNFGLPVIARMKDGVTREQLATELTQLSKELPGRFGGTPNYVRTIERHSAVIDPMLDRMVGPTVRTSLWVLLGAVSIVLLIACANVTNLFLVRAEGKRRDMAVRRAIGASRTQLVRLQMSEAFLVALPAGVLAVFLSTLTLPLFVRAAPAGIPRLGQAGLDVVTVAAAFALVMLAALLCGALPALRASAPDLTRLRDAWRSTGRHHWGRNLLVVGQTALALVLLIGSALLVQSFQRLRNVDAGYDIKDIYTFQFAPDQPQLVDGPSWGRLHLMFMDRLRALPGVTAVGVVNNIPLDEGTGSWRFLTDAMSRDEWRHDARHQLHRRRLLQRDGNRAAPGAHVHERRSRHAEQQRRHQPLDSGAALGGSESAWPAAPACRQHQHQPAVHRRRRRRGREAVRLARGRPGRGVFPADWTDRQRVGAGARPRMS